MGQVLRFTVQLLPVFREVMQRLRTEGLGEKIQDIPFFGFGGPAGVSFDDIREQMAVF